MVLFLFLTFCSTIDSEFFAPQEMVIQHDIQLAIILRLVPPACQTSWMFILMLIVRGYMLTPCWGGVKLGGMGWVNYWLQSYGKDGIVIAHECTDMHIVNEGKWVTLYRNRIRNFVNNYDSLVLFCWSDKGEIFIGKR